MARLPERVQVRSPFSRKPERAVLPLREDVFRGAPSVSGAGAQLQDIAAALASFSDSIGRYGAVTAALNKDLQDRRALEFAALPVEEQRRLAEERKMPSGESMRAYAQVQKIAGNALAERTLNQITADMEVEFDWETGNVDQYIVSKAAPIAERYRDMPAMYESFQESIIRARQRARNLQEQKRAEIRDNRRRQATFEAFRQSYALAKQNGYDLDRLKEVYMSARKAVGPGSPLNNTLAQLDEEAFRFAEAIVEMDPDFALWVAFGDRKDASGQTIPGIGYKADYAERAQRLQDRALKEKSKRILEASKDELVKQDLAAMDNGELLPEVTDTPIPTPMGTEIFTAKEREQRRWDAWAARSEAISKKNFETPQQRLNREVEEISRLGGVNPYWKAMFANVLQNLTPQSLQDPNTLAQLEAKYNTYAVLRTRKFVAERHLDEPTEKFFDLVWTALRYGVAQDTGTALQMAYNATQPVSDEDEMIGLSALSTAINKLVKNEGFNTDQTRAIRDVAKLYLRLGLNPEQALQQAKEKINGVDGWFVDTPGQFVSINGYKTPIPKDENGFPIALPSDFEEIATEMIEEEYERGADKEEYKLSDLTLKGNSDGTWQIVEKATGIPVFFTDPETGRGYRPTFTVYQFQKFKKEKEEEELNMTVNRLNQQDDRVRKRQIRQMLKRQKEWLDTIPDPTR